MARARFDQLSYSSWLRGQIATGTRRPVGFKAQGPGRTPITLGYGPICEINRATYVSRTRDMTVEWKVAVRFCRPRLIAPMARLVCSCLSRAGRPISYPRHLLAFAHSGWG